MNTLTHYAIPQWLSPLFLLAISVPFIMIVLWVRKVTFAQHRHFPYLATATFFILYLFYISFAAFSGWFSNVGFPPKVLIYTTFPFTFFLFGLIANLKIYQNIIEKTNLEDLVKLHIFRFIGVFFVLFALYDALPKTFAYLAGFGDMLTAISSIFVVRAIRTKKSYAKKLTYVWNTFGLVDILFTAITANVLTKLSIDTGSMGVDTLAVFPFCIIPAFAPPTILFLHWSIFKKLQKKSV